ncbi:MAG: hypothetical protein Q7R89_02750 [bacterium]|nr:hypothetical protein [bacterium]
MSLQDILNRIKPQQIETVQFNLSGEVEHFQLFRKLFLVITIVLVAFLSFGIGRLSVAGNREPIRVEYDPSISNSQFPTRLPTPARSNGGQVSNQASVSSALNNIENALKTENSKIENSTSVVASKNGARYHYPHCAGAKQIKEENKIVFATPAAAEAAGFTLAANCKPK